MPQEIHMDTPNLAPAVSPTQLWHLSLNPPCLVLIVVGRYWKPFAVLGLGALPPAGFKYCPLQGAMCSVPHLAYLFPGSCHGRRYTDQ